MCQAFNLTLLAPFYRKVNRLRIKGPPPLPQGYTEVVLNSG